MSYKELQSNDGSFNTPKYLFNYLDRFFHFELDPCDSGNNWLGLPHTFTKEQDGLEQEWNYNTFVNPPYGKKNELEWLDKIRAERIKYRENHYFILLPAKTEAEWFGRTMVHADVVIFPSPRVSFIKDGKVKHGNNIGSVIFGFRALNEKGWNELKDFERYNRELLGFTTWYDGEDNYLIYPDITKLRKMENELELFHNYVPLS